MCMFVFSRIYVISLNVEGARISKLSRLFVISRQNSKAQKALTTLCKKLNKIVKALNNSSCWNSWTVLVWISWWGSETMYHCVYRIRDVPDIHFVFASVPNSGPNSVFWRIVSSERIRIVSLYMYSAASDVYGRYHSVSARCSCSDRLILGDKWRGEGHG